MRQLIPIVLASILWLSTGRSALGDGMILPETLSPDYLAVRVHKVTVTIEDNHAVTRVEQEFYNPHDVQVSGRYLFPIPPDAILSRFEATMGGVIQTVGRQDAAATNAALYAVLGHRHDPSLLQYVDWESLAFDVNLPPGGSRSMSLEYEEVLAPSSGGLYHYRYVLSTERYSSRPVEEVLLTVDLHSSSGLSSVYSSGHQVTIERLGAGRARVRWGAQNVTPAEDFFLFFAPAQSGFGGGLLTAQGRGVRDEGGGHFLFLFSPDTEPHRADILPKDIVFVIDRSGSMAGQKIEQGRNAMHYVLDQLGEEDLFTIIGFSDRLHVFNYALQPVEWGTLREARRYVERLTADGSTDLESALQTALEILLGTPDRGATRMVVFLTDGLPTAGVTDGTLIAHQVTGTNAAAGARLHVFGVGYDVNTHLLDRLAADNRGTVTYVQPAGNLEFALTEFYSTIAHPVLADVKVEFEGMEVENLYPERIPDLFRGSGLLLSGRYRALGDTATVRVSGRAGGERREYVYRSDLSETGGHDFVPRLWATRRVGGLLDQVRVEGWSQELEDEIRELGLSYGIVTPYTTFVVESRSEGAASAANMALYGLAAVNQASGQVTIEARVQNQIYQDASQADLAGGTNVTYLGQQSLAQVGTQQLDLSLLRGEKDLDGPITSEWLESNIHVDRTVEFGSEAYFALAADPEARIFLQSGRNVVFGYRGQIIAVRDRDQQPTTDSPQTQANTPSSMAPDLFSSGRALHPVLERLSLLACLAAFGVAGMLPGLVAVAAVARYFAKSR